MISSPGRGPGVNLESAPAQLRIVLRSGDAQAMEVQRG